MDSPKVSIITVNYKQPGVTCDLLDSIAALSYSDLETIVVNNEQTDDQSFLFQLHLPEARVINVKENTGFAGGNNIGIRNSCGDFILLLNNDTEVNDGLIEGLLEVYERESNVGAVSPILKYHSDPERIQFAGFTKINPLTGRNALIQDKPENEIVSTPYFHGAAVMIPKNVIEECGYMPEDYFLYYEELEWSSIIARKGYQLKVASNLSVLHKESITTGKHSPLKVYYQNRNRIHFMRRQSTGYKAFLLFFLLFSVPKNFLQFLLKREGNHLKAFIKGVKDALLRPKYGQQPIT